MTAHRKTPTNTLFPGVPRALPFTALLFQSSDSYPRRCGKRDRRQFPTRLCPVITQTRSTYHSLCQCPFLRRAWTRGKGAPKASTTFPHKQTTTEGEVAAIFRKANHSKFKTADAHHQPPVSGANHCKWRSSLTVVFIHPSSIDSMVMESHLKQWAAKQAQQTIQLHRVVWEKTTGKKSCAFQLRHELDAVLTICTVPCKHYETAPTFTASFGNPNAMNHLTEGRPGP